MSTRSHDKEVTNYFKNIKNAIIETRTLYNKMKAIRVLETIGPNGDFEYIAGSVLLRDVEGTINRATEIEKISKIYTQVMSIAEKARLVELMEELKEEGEELVSQEKTLMGKVCAHEINAFRYKRPNR